MAAAASRYNGGMTIGDRPKPTGLVRLWRAFGNTGKGFVGAFREEAAFRHGEFVSPHRISLSNCRPNGSGFHPIVARPGLHLVGIMPIKPVSRHRPDPRAVSTVDAAHGNPNHRTRRK